VPGEFRYKRRVQFAETDLEGIVHFSWFFRYMEEAEHALWRAAGMTVARAGLEMGWPRISATFEFKSPLRFEDEFEVAVRIVTMSRRSIQYGHVVTRGSTLVGTGSVTTVCVSKTPDGDMKSMEIPQGVADRLRAAAGGGALSPPAAESYSDRTR
jgi:acyl-CoA thioester hydrolase